MTNVEKHNTCHGGCELTTCDKVYAELSASHNKLANAVKVMREALKKYVDNDECGLDGTIGENCFGHRCAFCDGLKALAQVEELLK